MKTITGISNYFTLHRSTIDIIIENKSFINKKSNVYKAKNKFFSQERLRRRRKNRSQKSSHLNGYKINK